MASVAPLVIIQQYLQNHPLMSGALIQTGTELDPSYDINSGQVAILLNSRPGFDRTDINPSATVSRPIRSTSVQALTHANRDETAYTFAAVNLFDALNQIQTADIAYSEQAVEPQMLPRGEANWCICLSFFDIDIRNRPS